jgi:hypothetical protein
MNMTSVYARLTGLLLDVLLYVERKGNSSVRNVETDITPKVHELVKKIRINHDGKYFAFLRFGIRRDYRREAWWHGMAHLLGHVQRSLDQVPIFLLRINY